MYFNPLQSLFLLIIKLSVEAPSSWFMYHFDMNLVFFDNIHYYNIRLFLAEQDVPAFTLHFLPQACN